MDFLRLLAGNRTPFLDGLFSFCTLFGEQIIVIFILCTIFWCIDKKLAYRIGVSYILAATVLNGVKIATCIPRPWVLDSSFNAVESAKPAASGYSMPSGHVQTAATVYGTLGLTIKKWWAKVIAVALILLVGFSRMYLGVHTPADVGVGLAIGVVAALSAVLLLKCDEKNLRQALPVGIVILIPAVLLMLFAYARYGGGSVDYKDTLDCFKISGLGIGFSLGYVIERGFVRFGEKTEKLWMQFVKVGVGMGVLAGMKFGSKPLLGNSFEANLVVHAMFMLWMTAVWPAIFTKLFKTAKEE